MKPTAERIELLFATGSRQSPVIKSTMMVCVKVFRRKRYLAFLAKLPKVYSEFVSEEKRQDPVYMKRLQKDLVENHYVYMISASEYFLFDFSSLTSEQKYSFVGDYERILLCHLARGKEWTVLCDKYTCYERFKSFYKRDALAVKNEADRDAFYDFIGRHGCAIIKEAHGSMGKGVQLIHNVPSEMDRFWESIRDSLSKKGGYIAEEVIHQCDELAQFHPSSVNTVRVMTFRKDGEVCFLGSFFRMGCGTSVVDNAGSGGVFAEIDVRSGRVIGSGITETGKRFDFHPDTGIKIKDYQLPRWDELLDFCSNLSAVLEGQPYVGWDCALTDDGWVMVEGNSQGQFVNQYPNRHGMRKTIQETFYPMIGLK